MRYRIAIAVTALFIAGLAPPVAYGRDAAPADELLVNGGFEQGLRGWQKRGDFAYRSDGRAAHTGNAYVVGSLWNDPTGGDIGKPSTGTLSQDFRIPSNAEQAELRFWLNIGSSESSTAAPPKDALHVQLVWDTASTTDEDPVLATLDTFTEQDADRFASYALAGPYDIAPHRGRNLRLVFGVDNDAQSTTPFFVDDVSLK
jgi:hypothetical protein